MKLLKKLKKKIQTQIINLNNKDKLKQCRTLLLIAIVTLGFNTVQAQQKVGHISTDLLISLMPETKVLNADLEKLSKTYESELKAENDKLKLSLKRLETDLGD